MDNEQDEIRKVMSMLGSRKSDAKTAAARENAKQPRPNRKPKPLASIECTCGGEGLDHKAGCLRGRAIRYREKHGLPME